MKRYPLLVCLALVLLLAHAGTASAETTTTTTTAAAAMTAEMTTTPERIGGSIFFETDPPGAMIWLDNEEIGTSPFTYYTEKTGLRDVSVWKKGYEGSADTVTVEEGRRVVFYAKLSPLPRTSFDDVTPTVTLTVATTIRKSTLTVPTPWPTSPQSPGDPAVVIAAAVFGIGFLVIQRR